jgi:antibiotic biosynthesis monooxygenase
MWYRILCLLVPLGTKEDPDMRFWTVALIVTLWGSAWPSAQAQAPQPGFAALLDAARLHPGCLGIDTGQTASGKRVIFAWFEDKAALVSWYKSEAHQRAMKVAFPNLTFNREPLPDTPDNSGQILAIVSLKLNEGPSSDGARLPIGTIGIELYTPRRGGGRPLCAEIGPRPGAA